MTEEIPKGVIDYYNILLTSKIIPIVDSKTGKVKYMRKSEKEHHENRRR